MYQDVELSSALIVVVLNYTFLTVVKLTSRFSRIFIVVILNLTVLKVAMLNLSLLPQFSSSDVEPHDSPALVI